MSELQFHVEWESPEGALGPELRATWARLQIVVDGEPVTQVEDKIAGSVRNAVYGPMYPLAEWIAANWWPLLYEIESPARDAGDGYLQRHTLSSAGEGFALPALRFHPEGRKVDLVWEPRDPPRTQVRFLARGRKSIERSQVADALRTFVSSVVARLEDQKCSGSFLAEEWSSVEASSPEEEAFCRAAGILGWDPYSLSYHRRRTIIKTAELLPEEIRDETFAAMNPTKLLAQGETVRDFIEKASRSNMRLAALEDLRARLQAPDARRSPWEQGYHFARQLRQAIPNHRRVRSAAELAQFLGVAESSWDQSIETGIEKLNFLDALVVSTKAGAPRIALQTKHERSRTFTLCRALFEYLHDKNASAGVVAPTYSERQKRNRAFAAEFLAPAEEIRREIKGTRTVTADQVEELAEEFGTSELVIWHQVENHGLANFPEWRFW